MGSAPERGEAARKLRVLLRVHQSGGQALQRRAVHLVHRPWPHPGTQKLSLNSTTCTTALQGGLLQVSFMIFSLALETISDLRVWFQNVHISFL